MSKKSVRVNFACTKRLLNLSAEANINARNARLCVRCAIFFLKIKQIPFFVPWSRDLYFWRDSKINSRCYWRCVLSWQVLFQQREMRIDWRLFNKSAIHLWLWKLWRLVVCSQSSSNVTGAGKDGENKQNTLFLLKQMNFVPNKQLLPNVPFQWTKYRKKDLFVDIKVQEAIGDVYCPTCRNGKCVNISTNKTTSFYDCKKCKACCHVLKFPLKDQKPKIVLIGGDGTQCFTRKTSRDYEKENPSPFSKKLLHQWDPSVPEHEPKKAEVIPFMVYDSVDTPLVDTVNQNFIFIFVLHTFSLQ